MNQKSLLTLVTTFSVIALVVVLAAFIYISRMSKTSTPGMFAQTITAANTGTFELQSSIDPTTVVEGQDIPVEVYITTSGEPFNGVVAEVSWPDADLQPKWGNGTPIQNGAVFPGQFLFPISGDSGSESILITAASSGNNWQIPANI